MLRQATQADGQVRDVHLAGWKRQAKDDRDAAYALKLHRGLLGDKPPTCDNRKWCSPVENQASIGSCTANAFAALIECNQLRAASAARVAAAAARVSVGSVTTSPSGGISYIATVTPAKTFKGRPSITVSTPSVGASGVVTFTTILTPPPTPAPAPSPSPAPVAQYTDVSRLFHYYATRTLEGTANRDSGATIRGTIKAGNTYGLLSESMWPYDVSKFAVRPPQNLWDTAKKQVITSYHAITDGDLESMKAALVSGYLVEFGFDVYTAFLSQQMASTGLLCRPKASERIQGGHAVALVGYDDNKVMPDGSTGAFLVRNSWGTSWGLSGYFWMAYNYVSDTSLCSDFWVVVSQPL